MERYGIRLGWDERELLENKVVRAVDSTVKDLDIGSQALPEIKASDENVGEEVSRVIRGARL